MSDPARDPKISITVTTQEASAPSGLMIVVHVKTTLVGGLITELAKTMLGSEHAVVLSHGEPYALSSPARHPF